MEKKIRKILNNYYDDSLALQGSCDFTLGGMMDFEDKAVSEIMKIVEKARKIDTEKLEGIICVADKEYLDDVCPGPILAQIISKADIWVG